MVDLEAIISPTSSLEEEKQTAIELAVSAKMQGFEDKYCLMMTKQCDSLREENGDICIFCGDKNCIWLEGRFSFYFSVYIQTINAITRNRSLI